VKPPVEARTRAGTFWAWFPVVLIVSMLAGLGTMAYIAVDDPGFAVEKDYYQKAVHWDQTQAQNEKNARLGWNVALELAPRGGKIELVAKLVDASGTPIRDASVDVEAFANARAAEIVSAHLVRQQDGTQKAELPLTRTGLWEFRFTAQARGQRFTQVVRHDVAAGDPS
jgi:hypothetical protein